MGADVPGQLLIWYAFAANLIAGLAFFKLARGDGSYRSLALRSYQVLTLASGLAAAYLFYLFFTHDFTVKYVFEYSDRSLPFFYVLSAFWAGQEGTYLLWLLLSVAFGYAILKRGGVYTNYAMVIYSLVNFFFLTLLVKVSPFKLLDFAAADGAGLNPLLQDPWMVVHPPVIFVGYAASAVPFAIAIAALILNDYRDWIRRVFPWQVVTTLMLAGGNILGGYWAYKTLGWGGYWAWDPVENSSFIPWFVSLALLHSMVLEKRTGALRRTNMLLTALVFLLVVYGTFLTRSGVLADFSVHSFVDLGANVYLVGFLILFVALTLLMFLLRTNRLGRVPVNYNVYSRDFFLFAGMLLLFLFGMIVLFWTSLPLLTSWLSATPRAADKATYNGFALPFAVLLAFLLTVSPFTSPLSFVPQRFKTRLVWSVGLAVLAGVGLFLILPDAGLVFTVLLIIVVTGLSVYLMKPDLIRWLAPAVIALFAVIILSITLGLRQPMYILFIAAAVMSVFSNVIYLVRQLPHAWRLVGGQLTHFGFGLMLLGVLSSNAFSSNEHLILPKGDSREAYGLTVSYEGMERDLNQPKNKLLLTVEEDGQTVEAHPELYFSKRLDGIMRKPYIQKSLLYDTYFSPQQVQEPNPQEGLQLTKDEPKQIGEFTLTFAGFEMGQHNPGEGSLRVVANLWVQRGNSLDTIAPAVVAITKADGSTSMMDFPAQIGDAQKYPVSIERILADQAAVVLNIPGLTDAGQMEALVLDISKKPVINLVWAGTTLILLGCVIAFLRRRAELAG
ncbi:MAG TPA: cytochrome c biogenesis protein CcsA [Candidatus Deferrimicrobium sp.]|nr:cytochrome c biogenesis protein CcsA [Candidatus Deferrimicrobium sp.]